MSPSAPRSLLRPGGEREAVGQPYKGFDPWAGSETTALTLDTQVSPTNLCHFASFPSQSWNSPCGNSRCAKFQPSPPCLRSCLQGCQMPVIACCPPLWTPPPPERANPNPASRSAKRRPNLVIPGPDLIESSPSWVERGPNSATRSLDSTEPSPKCGQAEPSAVEPSRHCWRGPDRAHKWSNPTQTSSEPFCTAVSGG